MCLRLAPMRPLPNEAVELLKAVDAPPRLVAHLRLVHDAAGTILQKLRERWPSLPIDPHAVLFGAATHHIGKARCLAELTAAGHRHEHLGEQLLLEAGIVPERARFARTHSQWEGGDLEDLLVALADKVWKGKRDEKLEQRIVERIADVVNEPAWQVFLALDGWLTDIGTNADARLRWQEQSPAL